MEQIDTQSTSTDIQNYIFRKSTLNLSISNNQKWQPTKLVTNHIAKSKLEDMSFTINM